MKSKSEPVTLQTQDGKNFPGKRKDDGIRTAYTAKYVDTIIPGWLDKTEPERVEALASYRSAPRGAKITGVTDPLNADMQEAARYLERLKVAAPGTLGEDDTLHLWRLHAELGNLRDALDGDDLRHAARSGVAFGKALDEMRVRLWASAVKRAKAHQCGSENGAESKREEADERYIALCEYFDEARADGNKIGDSYEIAKRRSAEDGYPVSARTVRRAVTGK